MCSGIPEGTYELKIGASFLGANKFRPPEFNTLRFDFKPASISAEASEAYIVQSQNQNENNNFQVVVLGGEAQKKTIFKGAKKAFRGDKECLLVFNRESKELCLERVSANINVKKTRDTDLDQNVISQIGRLQKRKPQNSTPLPPPTKTVENVVVAAEPAPEQRKERTFSASSAGDEIDEDDESALEQLLMAPTKVEQSRTEEEVVQPPQQQLKMEEHQISRTESAAIAIKREEGQREETNCQQSPEKQQQQQQPMPVKKTSSFVRKSILAEDLQLSESSSEEDGGDSD